jgi:hypothetical protein
MLPVECTKMCLLANFLLALSGRSKEEPVETGLMVDDHYASCMRAQKSYLEEKAEFY